jgi:hypothetical protein
MRGEDGCRKRQRERSEIMDLINNADLDWDHFSDGEQFGKPVDYWGTTLSIRDDGHVDVLYRWEPNASCHFHRHIAPLSSIVLEGELHVIDFENGKELARRVRKAGNYSQSDAVEDHLEVGGPQGALVMFSIYAPDGRLTQQLSEAHEILRTITAGDLRARQAALV